MKALIVGLVALTFSTAVLADRDGHHRREPEHRSHRGDDIAAAVVVGGILGYLIADNKDSNHTRSTTSVRRWCERNVPPRYENNRRLSKAWVKGCIQRVQEEESELAEEAYNNGYGR